MKSSPYKWEYKIICIGGSGATVDADDEAQLNDLGEQGWEIVSADVGFSRYVFKRPGAQRAASSTLEDNRMSCTGEHRLADYRAGGNAANFNP